MQSGLRASPQTKIYSTITPTSCMPTVTQTQRKIHKSDGGVSSEGGGGDLVRPPLHTCASLLPQHMGGTPIGNRWCASLTKYRKISLTISRGMSVCISYPNNVTQWKINKSHGCVSSVAVGLILFALRHYTPTFPNEHRTLMLLVTPWSLMVLNRP